MKRKAAVPVAATEPTPETAQETKPTLTPEDLTRAALNTPELAKDSFTLGDKEYKILDLGYRDYTKFLFYLQPLLETFMGTLTSRSDISVPGLSIPMGKIDPSGIMKYCEESLPAMACIVCKQTDPEMTPEKIMDVAKSPMQLARIVLQQIIQNKMIEEFVDFFGALTQLLAAK